MSLIENLKTRATGNAPSPGDIKAELTLAEAALADAEAKHGSAALAAFAHEAGADATLRDLEQKLVAQRQRVATLRAAHKAAVEREAERIAEQRASLRRTQLRALKKHVETRNTAAVELSKAIANCAIHYRALQQASKKARAATPIGMNFPDGANFEDQAIKDLVRNHMWKVSAQPGDADGLALPGAQYPDVKFQYQPDGFDPLDVTIKAGSDHVLGKLKIAGKD